MNKQPITLATLHLATEQEVFDQVCSHLLTQNKKSQLSASTCAYKNEEGLKCAAGCLISNEEYDKTMEGHSWSSLVRAKLVPKCHEVLISRLQLIHDNVQVEYWESYFKDSAKEFHLDYQPNETD